MMSARVTTRKAFGKYLAEFDNVLEDIAKCRAQVDKCRHLLHSAAHLMDTRGNKDAYTRQLLSLVKADVPIVVQNVVDKALQVHGGMGTCQDNFLGNAFLICRFLLFADGADEVHWRTA